MTNATLINHSISDKTPLDVSVSHQVHHFTINVDIDKKNARSFVDHLNTYGHMEKARVSATTQGLCIKMKTSNKSLGDFILRGIHAHTNVRKVNIVAG